MPVKDDLNPNLGRGMRTLSWSLLTVLLMTWLSVAAQRTDIVRGDCTVCTGARRLVMESMMATRITSRRDMSGCWREYYVVE